MTKPKSILTSAIVIAVTTVFVRTIGFLREVVLAAIYGAGAVSDAFVIAFNVPHAMLVLIGSSFAVAYIPMFTKTERNKKRFTSNVLTILALAGLLFSMLFSFIPQALTYIFASRFDSERFNLTTDMLRFMVWSFIPILFTGIIQGYLQIKKAFFFASAASIPINIMVIASMWFGKTFEMPSILGLGTLAGYTISIWILLAAAKQKGYAYRPVLDFKMPELRSMMLLIIPIGISNMISELNQIIDRNFASSLITGSVSSLNYAGKLVGTITLLLGGSLTTVIFPNLSELAAVNDIDKIRYYISVSIKKLLPLLLPAALGIILMADPIVKLLFERGGFTTEDTVRTAECLRIYALLIITSSISGIAVRAFFSLSDTKTPAVISAVSVAVNIVLNFTLIESYKHQGLALATAAASLFSAVILLLTLKRKLGSLRLFDNFQDWIKTLAALLCMWGTVFTGRMLLPATSDSTIVNAVRTVGIIIAGAASYVFVHFVLQTELFRDGMKIFNNIIKHNRRTR